MVPDEGVAAEAPVAPVAVPAIERRYTVAEVAEIAKLSTETVYEEIRRGLLRARRKRHSTRGYVVMEGELRRWLEDEFEEVPAQ